MTDSTTATAPRTVDGRPGPREAAGAPVAPRSRRTRAGVALGHPRWVGERSKRRRGRREAPPRRRCQRPGRGRTPLHTARGEGGGINLPVYCFVDRSRRLGTPAVRWDRAGSAAAGALERPLLSPTIAQTLATERNLKSSTCSSGQSVAARRPRCAGCVHGVHSWQGRWGPRPAPPGKISALRLASPSAPGLAWASPFPLDP